LRNDLYLGMLQVARRRKNDVAELILMLRQRRIVLPSETVVQRKARAHLPVVLAKKPPVAGAEVLLGVAGRPGTRIGIDGLEDRSLVGQVPKPGKRVERARAAQ